MKTYKLIGLFAIFQFFQSANAQTNYPNAPDETVNIINAEYYIDNDPGLGLAIPINIIQAKTISDKTIEIPLTGITKGVHFFHLRTKDGNGKWSQLANKLFTNQLIPDYNSAANKKVLIEAEYFFDADPGHGKGTKLLLNDRYDTSSFSTSINLPSLSQGIHVFYLRSKDDLGKWSISAAKLFNYTNVFPYPKQQPAPIYIIAAEAFIDSDPGYGNGIPVTITPGGNISSFSFDLPLNGLNSGVHHVYVRSKERPWSMAAVVQFVYGTVLPLRWVYFKGEIKDKTTLLNWRTSSKLNTQSFNVQHSTDGLQFSTLYSLPAKTGSGTENDYSYKHETPSSGFNFYRIQQIDQDRKSTYSAVLQLLNNSISNSVVLAPNPGLNETYVIQNKAAFVRGYKIYNSTGQVVQAENLNIFKEAVWQLDLHKMNKGVYTISIEYTDHNEVLRFLKN